MTERADDASGNEAEEPRSGATEGDETAETDGQEDDSRERDRTAALEQAEQDDTVSDSKSCPECGEPVHNLRATCPNCGREYQDSDRDDEDSGTEFVAGTEVPDEEKGDALKPSSDATPRGRRRRRPGSRGRRGGMGAR